MPNNLSWMHYERLMRVKNEDERDWYLREASTENWSYRTLKPQHWLPILSSSVSDTGIKTW